MVKKLIWDYALRIKGLTLRTLPVSHLADCLKELVGLMGEDSRPVLDVSPVPVLWQRDSQDHRVLFPAKGWRSEPM